MRLLLDTHAFLWWLDGDRRLSLKARRGNDTNAILVSAASAWEITTKARLGKLPGAADVAADVAACVASQGCLPLDIILVLAAHLPCRRCLRSPRRTITARRRGGEADAEECGRLSSGGQNPHL
jgi:PIN domain nuclease of toxin-antitoxin system